MKYEEPSMEIEIMQEVHCGLIGTSQPGGESGVWPISDEW